MSCELRIPSTQEYAKLISVMQIFFNPDRLLKKEDMKEVFFGWFVPGYLPPVTERGKGGGESMGYL